MLIFIGYIFYGVGIADLLAMFFGCDFTGQPLTPVMFVTIGTAFQSFVNKNSSTKIYF